MPSLNIDMEIPLNLLSFKLIEEIEKLSPFGPENPRPVFCSRKLGIKSHPRSIGENGTKFWVTDGKITCEAVGFKFNHQLSGNLREAVLDLAYSPSVNNWQNNKTIQLRLEDVKINF